MTKMSESEKGIIELEREITTMEKTVERQSASFFVVAAVGLFGALLVFSGFERALTKGDMGRMGLGLIIAVSAAFATRALKHKSDDSTWYLTEKTKEWRAAVGSEQAARQQPGFQTLQVVPLVGAQLLSALLALSASYQLSQFKREGIVHSESGGGLIMLITAVALLAACVVLRTWRRWALLSTIAVQVITLFFALVLTRDLLPPYNNGGSIDVLSSGLLFLVFISATSVRGLALSWRVLRSM